MDRVIHCQAKLNCTPRRAFEMFTNNALLQTWLAQVADVQPYRGGKYELFWDADHREANGTKGCTITALEPDRLLCFTWKGPVQFAHWMNVADPLTHVSVFFALLGDGGNATGVHLVHTGWRRGEHWEEARAWFERVWENALAALKKEVDK